MIKSFVKAAHEAGGVLLEMQSQAEVFSKRSSGDLTLTADNKSQELILKVLKSEFPDIPIVAEEDGTPEIFPETFITVDPLDGTIPYSKGYRDWGVNISYIENGQPVSGVIYLPASKQTLEVEQGKGCRLNGKELSPPKPEPGERFILNLDLHYANDPEYVSAVLVPLISKVRLTRSLGSSAALTVDFAAGRSDAHINHQGGGVWDIATLGAVALAMGHHLSDISGAPKSWDSMSTSILTARSDEIAQLILSHSQPFSSS
jgi:3'(2'), 5'-bisphosphate nucleotidase